MDPSPYSASITLGSSKKEDHLSQLASPQSVMNSSHNNSEHSSFGFQSPADSPGHHQSPPHSMNPYGAPHSFHHQNPHLTNQQQQQQQQQQYPSSFPNQTNQSPSPMHQGGHVISNPNGTSNVGFLQSLPLAHNQQANYSTPPSLSSLPSYSSTGGSKQVVTPTNQPIIKTTPTAPRKPSRQSNFSDDSTDLLGLNSFVDLVPSPASAIPQQIPPYRYPASNASASSISSRSSQSISSRTSQYQDSIINDTTFAPPPKFPESNNSNSLIHGHNSNSSVVQSTSLLPSFDLIKHSGQCMGRFSMKAMVTKKWKQAFWIAYGTNQLVFFRSKTDFEEWVSNPFLSKKDRDALVKLHVDFRNDLCQPGTTGYVATKLHRKEYSKNGMMHHFKLEKWMDYGPIITGAFASKNQNDLHCLRRLMLEMIDLSPRSKRTQDIAGYNSDTSTSAYGSDSKSIKSFSSSFSMKSILSAKSAPPSTNAQSETQSREMMYMAHGSNQQTNNKKNEFNQEQATTHMGSYHTKSYNHKDYEEDSKSKGKSKFNFFKQRGINTKKENTSQQEVNQTSVKKQFKMSYDNLRRSKSANPSRKRRNDRKMGRKKASPNTTGTSRGIHRVREAEVDYAL